jgi:enoyl-CoA hydratase
MNELEVLLADDVLRLTFNRPDQLNALTGEMELRLIEELRGAGTRDDVRAVLLTGEGAAFSAGADMAGEEAQERYDESSIDGANLVVRSLLEVDKPVVCGLNGVAAGVGMSIALACDLVVATESAALTLAFGKIGLMPDGGASALVAAAVGRTRAMRMALLAERIKADEALAWGLASAVYPADEFAAEVDKVIDVLKVGPAVSLSNTKAAINAATLGELDGALQRETEGQISLLSGTDFREGIKAFQQHRTPTFTDV